MDPLKSAFRNIAEALESVLGERGDSDGNTQPDWPLGRDDRLYQAVQAAEKQCGRLPDAFALPWIEYTGYRNAWKPGDTDTMRKARGLLSALTAAAEAIAGATEDDSGWVAASDVWQKHFGSYKEFRAFLDREDKVIRKRSPSKNRLEIHAGDWIKYWAARERAGIMAAGKASSGKSLTPDELSDEAIEGFAERYQAIHARKVAKE